MDVSLLSTFPAGHFAAGQSKSICISGSTQTRAPSLWYHDAVHPLGPSLQRWLHNRNARDSWMDSTHAFRLGSADVNLRRPNHHCSGCPYWDTDLPRCPAPPPSPQARSSSPVSPLQDFSIILFLAKYIGVTVKRLSGRITAQEQNHPPRHLHQ
ncbi:unnamed protein product [Sympodiomycopsis kandeliae]